MATNKVFINLPVKDLDRSMDFFRQLGYEFDPHFSDQTAACMVVSEDIYAMLLTEPKFKEFAPKDIADAKRSTEVLVALSADSRAAVDEMVSKAVQAGGTTFRSPEDHGFMYGQSFQDLDGHVWEYFWMDTSAVPPPA